MNGRLKCREVQTGYCRKSPMQTGSSETLLAGNLEKPLLSLYGTEHGGSVAMVSETCRKKGRGKAE